MNKKACIQGGNLTLVIIDQNTPNFAMFIVLKCLYNIIYLISMILVLYYCKKFYNTFLVIIFSINY